MRSSQTQVTLDGSVLGTPDYMSPEQARGDTDIDHRTDLYSAGVVLYEMLTGQTPFHADTPTATIHRILHDEPRDMRKIDPSVDPVLASLAVALMSKQPGDRPGSAVETLRVMRAQSIFHTTARRRRLRRGVLLTVTCVGAVLFAIGVSHRYTTDGLRQPTSHTDLSEITSVRVEGNAPTTILATCGYDTVKPLREFPPEAFSVAVWPKPVELSTPLSRGFVAATSSALGGNSLFLLDSAGRTISELDLSAPWPGYMALEWGSTHVVVGNLHPNPGLEVAVAARDPLNCPARVTIVALGPPLRPLGTVWHKGHLSGLRIVHDFFGPGVPAILAWGKRNESRDLPRTWMSERLLLRLIRCAFSPSYPKTLVNRRLLARYNPVSDVMILCPREMVEVPVGAASTVPSAPGMFAYAFLEQPASDQADRVLEGEATAKWLERLGWSSTITAIGQVDIVSTLGRTAPEGSRFMVKFERDKGGAGAQLYVDDDLAVLADEAGVLLVGNEHAQPDTWRARWHRVVQRGKLLQTP